MTDKYVVFGNPVAHSMSPQLHAFFASLTSEDISYDRALVEDGEFAATARRYFADGLKGCNITVPCKLDAYDFADTLSEYAKAAGAVNTLCLMDDGSVYGDNTDGRGLVYDLKRLGCPLKDSKILIIGAGGATRGILKPICDEMPQSITIINRTYEKAVSLAQNYKDCCSAVKEEELTGQFDVIINATSLSLSGTLPKLSDDILKKASFVYDLMYRRDADTVFTAKAKELGVEKAFDGFGMLVGQALLSFKLWRGVMPDFDTVIKHFR